MEKRLFAVILLLFSWAAIFAQETQSEYKITLKSPGNPADTYTLRENSGYLQASQALPVEIKHQAVQNGSATRITVTITAKDLVYYNFEEICKLSAIRHDDCQFFMPGFWYHRNMRSPKEAPSFATSDSWQIREDRLSTPLTGIYSDAEFAVDHVVFIFPHLVFAPIIGPQDHLCSIPLLLVFNVQN